MFKNLTFDKILNFITSLGASIVVFGALMKITHHQNADTFLYIGLITESIIFLIYAFIPPKFSTIESISLKEYMPKKIINDEVKDINFTEINQQMERLNQNLYDVNNILERFKNLFK